MRSRDSVRQLRSIDPVCWEGKCEPMKKESSEKSFELMKRNNIWLVYQTILAHSPLLRSGVLKTYCKIPCR